MAEFLPAVEAAVQAALASGSDQSLRILGNGEVSLVVGWPAAEPSHACKRLPVFPSAATADRYGVVLRQYVRRLEDRGVSVVPCSFEVVPTGKADRAGYVVQPVLPPGSLGPDLLRAATPDPDHPLVAAVVDAVVRVVDEHTGLDAQISNWAVVDDCTQYLDVTTPILYDEDGLALDVGVLVAAFPWLLRGPLRRFVVPSIAAAYCDQRTVLLDLAANLHKERLTEWIPAVLTAANRAVSPPITAEEALRYYRSDARMWEILLRVRRADRWWQRTVRRRGYPFLLPRPVDR